MQTYDWLSQGENIIFESAASKVWNCALEHDPRAFGRIYRIRIEYIFLCLRSKASRCGTDKCLLRNFSVYSRYPVIDYIQANSYGYLFYSINFYGNRCLAFFK